jgi:hypothetical protein
MLLRDSFIFGLFQLQLGLLRHKFPPTYNQYSVIIFECMTYCDSMDTHFEQDTRQHLTPQGISSTII